MSDPSLEQILSETPRASLRMLARAHQLGEPRAKFDLVQQLAQRLCDPALVQRTLEGLPPLAREIYTHVRETGGQAYVLSMQREFMRERSARVPHDRLPASIFRAALWPLIQYGLLLPTAIRGAALTPEDLAHRNVELLIPREVLDAGRADQRPLRASEASTFERVAEGSAHDFQRDVYLFWNYLRGQVVALTAAGLVPKRHVLKLNEAMTGRAEPATVRDESHLGRLHFIRLMLEESGLVKVTGRRLEPNFGARDFFSYSITRRTDRFFEAWKNSLHWLELTQLSIRPRVHVERSSRALQLVARARQVVLNLVAERAADGWLDINDLVATMRRENYEFLFKRTREEFGEINPYYYYHNPLGWGFPVGDEAEGWDKVESEYIGNIIAQPLHWLGLVDVGYAGEKPVAFRLTPLGAYLFGLADQPPAEPAAAHAGRVVVQPNFQIFALEPIAEQTLVSLDRFADRVKADKAFEYKLSRESLYRAHQNGMSAAEAVAFLERASSAPLPQNVLRTLEEWAQSYERIIVRRNAALLHALDPQVLDALQETPAVQRYLLGRPLPRVALASNTPESRERIAQALMALGHLPAYSDVPESENSSGALRLDESGKVSLLHALPDLYLLQALEEHAERRADGYYLTKAAVRGERAGGESADQLIARWQRWHHGPIPAALMEKLRGWLNI
jgi:hypothetical protein